MKLPLMLGTAARAILLGVILSDAAAAQTIYDPVGDIPAGDPAYCDLNHVRVRQSTDMLWFASDRIRRLSNNDIRKIYYVLLAVFVIWGVSYMNMSVPLFILAISANIANFTMALSAVLTIILNRKVLPKEFRGSIFREVILVCNLLFFGFFFSIFFLLKILNVKF